MKLIFSFSESSETHFDLVTSKIGAKLNNLVIYGDILVNFLRNLITKSTISQNLKIAKLWRLGIFPIYAYADQRSSDIYVKDARCAEPNENSIFRFLFFGLWLVVLIIYGDAWIFMCIIKQIKINRSKVAKITKKDAQWLKQMKNQCEF